MAILQPNSGQNNNTYCLSLMAYHLPYTAFPKKSLSSFQTLTITTMLLSLLGSIGLGMVWGWLLGKIAFFSSQSISQLLILVASTLLVGGEVYFFLDWQAVAAFSVGGIITLLLHYLWLKQLSKNIN